MSFSTSSVKRKTKNSNKGSSSYNDKDIAKDSYSPYNKND